MSNFTRSEAWKNFDLGQELAVSGAFIFNGLRTFHDMETLGNTDEVFEFLYNVAVGFERLIKVAVILIEHDDTRDQREFEISLLTHNHLDLLRRVTAQQDLKLARPHHRFLKLLTTFYSTHRYDRYVLGVGWEPDKERTGLTELLETNLNIELETSDLFAVQNTPRYRRHIGAIACKIARALFGVVRERAHELNLYTYELRHGSKAERIFLGTGCTFEVDDVLWKELLIFLMNTNEKSGLLDYLRGIDPLPFDKGMVPDYLRCFRSLNDRASERDELEELYTQLKSPGERLSQLEPLGEPGYYFRDPDDADPLLSRD